MNLRELINARFFIIIDLLGWTLFEIYDLF